MPENIGIEEITDSLKLYAGTNIELIKLEVVERSSSIGASLVSTILVGMACALFVLFLSIGAGFYLSSLLGNYYFGFAIIAGFYLLLTLFLLIGRKRLFERHFRDKIIKTVLLENEA